MGRGLLRDCHVADAPRSICVECQAFLRVWRRDGSIRVVVPRGFVSRGFRGGPPRSVATAACALRPPGPLCQLCHVAAADGRNQASSLSRVSPPGTPCTRPGARRDRPPDGALALLPATVPRPGGQSHQGGQRLPVVLPQFGQLGGQGGGGELPYARPINRNRPGRCGPRRVSSLRPSGASWACLGEREHYGGSSIRGNHRTSGWLISTTLKRPWDRLSGLVIASVAWQSRRRSNGGSPTCVQPRRDCHVPRQARDERKFVAMTD